MAIKRVDVLFLTQDGTLHVVDGTTGREQWSAKPPIPKGTQRWEHLVVANFRGAGDRDILLQATNAEGYRMGRFSSGLCDRRSPSRTFCSPVGNATISSPAPTTAHDWPI